MILCFAHFLGITQLAKKTATNKSYSCINREVCGDNKNCFNYLIWCTKYSLIANVTPLRFDTITPYVWYNRIKCHYHASQIKLTLYCVCNVIEWSRNVFQSRNISYSATSVEFECFELVFTECFCELFSSFAIKQLFTKQNSPT